MFVTRDESTGNEMIVTKDGNSHKYNFLVDTYLKGFK